MDNIDLKILTNLQQNARISLKKLSELCYISAPAVSTRLNRLEQKGFIRNYSALVNYDIVGYPIKSFVSLKLSPKDKPNFYPYIETVPNVVACDCVTGEFSQIITCYFKTTKELDDFINEIHHFGETQTQIVFSSPVPECPLNLNEV